MNKKDGYGGLFSFAVPRRSSFSSEVFSFLLSIAFYAQEKSYFSHVYSLNLFNHLQTALVCGEHLSAGRVMI